MSFPSYPSEKLYTSEYSILVSGGKSKKAEIKNTVFMVKTLTESHPLGDALHQVPSNCNTGGPAWSSPGDPEPLFILSPGSTATMPSTHRLHLVALKCRGTAENCKCFCLSMPVRRADKRYPRSAVYGEWWPALQSTEPSPVLCFPPGLGRVPHLLSPSCPSLPSSSRHPRTDPQPQHMCPPQHPSHVEMFSRYLT